MRFALLLMLLSANAYADCSGFDLAIDAFYPATGAHSIVVLTGFKTFQACVNAGNQAKQRFEGTVSFICVSKR